VERNKPILYKDLAYEKYEEFPGGLMDDYYENKHVPGFLHRKKSAEELKQLTKEENLFKDNFGYYIPFGDCEPLVNCKEWQAAPLFLSKIIEEQEIIKMKKRIYMLLSITRKKDDINTIDIRQLHAILKLIDVPRSQIP